MAKIVHSMIRVLDESRSLEFYKRAFALEVAARLQFDGFTLIYLRNTENDFELELTVNHDRTDAYSHGESYGHLAVVVDNIESERARFVAEGFDPTEVKELHHNSLLLARFFFVRDPDGYSIEVLQRHGRYQ